MNIDPLAPPTEAVALCSRLDAAPPTVVAVIIPHHIRDIDLFVRR